MSPDLLQPGDVLLYAGRGFFSWAIRVKTWSDVSHVEVYDGRGWNVASRNGLGVNSYPCHADGLVAVLRAKRPFDTMGAWGWFLTVRGQGYDWLGLLNFYWARFRGVENRRMFCSEFATRFLRAGGIEPFTTETDADTVAPGEFLKSGAFTRVDLAGVST